MNGQDGRLDEFERRARAAFDASVEGVDSEVRERLDRARFEAVTAADRKGARRLSAWIPAAAAAAMAMLAVLAWRVEAPQAPEAVAAQAEAVPAPAVELLANGDDIDLVSEDIDFYQWLDATGFDGGGGAG